VIELLYNNLAIRSVNHSALWQVCLPKRHTDQND